MQQEHIGVKGPPGTRWRTLSPDIRERQRPLTNNISSFNLLFRLGRLQPQRAELLEAMAVVVRLSLGSTTPGSLLNKTWFPSRPCWPEGGPGLLCWYGHAGNRAPSVPRRHGMGFRCPGHQASIATWQKDTGKPGAGQQTLRTSGCYPELLSRVKQETPE